MNFLNSTQKLDLLFSFAYYLMDRGTYMTCRDFSKLVASKASNSQARMLIGILKGKIGSITRSTTGAIISPSSFLQTA